MPAFRLAAGASTPRWVSSELPVRWSLTMSWCNKLASTPSVGLKFDYHFAPSTDILDVLAPILDKLVEGDKTKFVINRQDPFAIEFTTEDGFHYGVDPSRVWIDFQHRLRVKPTSGGPPVAELLSRPAPFSELLPDVSKRLIDASDRIVAISPRKLTRVGVVASTSVADDELPPGMARFIQYIGRPWHGFVEQYSFQITADLGKSDDWFDRCTHIVIKSEDPEQLLTLRFDWHRTFVSGRAATHESLKEALDQAAVASMAYFEDLAEGNRFDEELIRSAT